MNRAPSSAAPGSRIPRPSPGCDIRSLPIGPQEAFVLSRVDGSTAERDLVAVTGLDATTVTGILDRLCELGAICIDDRSAPAEAASPQPEAPRYDAAELDSPSDLTVDKKRDVLELFARLDEMSYYELLGVGPDAERKDLRRGYYARAPLYHPDKFYGKDLGAFKSKMEAIFGKLTVAYETLSDPDDRAEYDAYLDTQKETAVMEQLLHGPVVVATPETEPTPVPVVSQPPSPTPSVLPRTPEQERARRSAFARRLKSILPPEVLRGSGPPAVGATEAALQDLVRRRDAAVADAPKAQVRRYVEAAKLATEQKNPAAAANAYRLALAVDPDNPELVRAHQEAARVASAALADGYLRQAEYEARTGKWSEAARSYVRAAAGMPNDPDVQCKAAYALLRAGGDLHQAVDYAQRAITLAPKHFEAHVTLAEIYLVAGRALLARREIDTAREINPQDDRIKQLAKRLR